MIRVRTSSAGLGTYEVTRIPIAPAQTYIGCELSLYVPPIGNTVNFNLVTLNVIQSGEDVVFDWCTQQG